MSTTLRIAALLLPFALSSELLASIDLQTDIGCRPNDMSFDNGAVITSFIRDGKVEDTIDCPGGTYYHTSTIDICGKDGVAILGQGITHWNVEGEFQPNRRGAASVRFVYIGPPDQPAWRINGFGARIEGINIWRGWKEPPHRDGSVGIEFSRLPNGPPAGKHYLNHICVAGFETGLQFKHSTNHVDNISIGFLRAESCWIAIDCNNPQTVNIDVRFLQLTGPGHIGLQFDRGGGLVVGILELVEPRLLFNLKRTDGNTCSYVVEQLRVDNNAAGWQLVHQDRPGGLRLRIGGLIGHRATPSEDAIRLRPQVVNGVAVPQDIKIDLYWAGRTWPGK